MAFTLELEEWVGSAWHRFITRRASVDFPHARVELVDRQRSLAVLFRALGGASGIALEAASERDLLLRRNSQNGRIECRAWRCTPPSR